jgi:hypothetical protein
LVIEFDGLGWTEIMDPGDFRIDDYWLSRFEEIGGDLVDAADIHAMFGFDENDVWAVGTKILHWDGEEWATFAEFPEFPAFRSIWGSAKDDIWAVAAKEGDSRFVHFDGEQWTVYEEDSGYHVKDLWGCSSDSIWGVGDTGISYWDGSGWAKEHGGPIWAVWGSGPEDIWAGGKVMYRWDGLSWQLQLLPVDRIWINDISGTCPDHILVSGYSWSDEGTSGIMRWDGSSWSWIFDEKVNGILASRRGDIWAVGEMGLLMGKHGGDWIVQESGTRNYLRGVYELGDSIWVYGHGAIIAPCN